MIRTPCVFPQNLSQILFFGWLLLSEAFGTSSLDCGSICNLYLNDNNTTALQGQLCCSANAGNTTLYPAGNSSYPAGGSSCDVASYLAQLQTASGMVGDYCAAEQEASDTKIAMIAIVAADAIAAASCSAAAYAEAASAGTLALWANGVCDVAAIGALAGQVYDIVKLGQDQANYSVTTQFYTDAFGSQAAGAALAGGALLAAGGSMAGMAFVDREARSAAQTAATEAGRVATEASQELLRATVAETAARAAVDKAADPAAQAVARAAAEEAAEKVIEKKALEEAAKAAAKAAVKKAGEAVTTKVAAVGAGIAAAMMIAATAADGVLLDKVIKTLNSSCGQIQQAFTGSAPGSLTLCSAGGSDGGGGAALGGSQAPGLGGSPPPGSSTPPPSTGGGLGQTGGGGAANASTYTPPGGSGGGSPATSPATAAVQAAAASGGAGGALAAAMDAAGLPDSVKTAAQNMLKTVSSLPGIELAGYKGAAGKVAKKEPVNPFSFFGSKSADSGLGAASTAASAKRDESDIYHTGWKESVFQIVSMRVQKSKSDFQALEPCSPMNRALLGLDRREPISCLR
jgi:hypothetical protein